MTCAAACGLPTEDPMEFSLEPMADWTAAVCARASAP